MAKIGTDRSIAGPDLSRVVDTPDGPNIENDFAVVPIEVEFGKIDVSLDGATDGPQITGDYVVVP